MIKVVKFENSEEILGENFNVTPAEMFSNGYVSEILISLKMQQSTSTW